MINTEKLNAVLVNYKKDFVDVDQQRFLEQSRQRLENVDQTHLVLASGKLVLQIKKKKKIVVSFIPLLLCSSSIGLL